MWHVLCPCKAHEIAIGEWLRMKRVARRVRKRWVPGLVASAGCTLSHAVAHRHRDLGLSASSQSQQKVLPLRSARESQSRSGTASIGRCPLQSCDRPSTELYQGRSSSFDASALSGMWVARGSFCSTEVLDFPSICNSTAKISVVKWSTPLRSCHLRVRSFPSK